MEDDVDFALMRNVGLRVNEILCQDPNMQEWVQAIIEEYNKNYEYPETLIMDIINYLSDLKDRDENELVDDIKRIVFDKTNVDNLLGYIFFPSTGEEEEEEAQVDTCPTIEEELPTEINEASLSPEQYFEHCVKKASELCYVSNDIAYALLSKFLWDRNQLEVNWFSKRDDILKSLRIKEGSDLVPDLHSPLSMKFLNEGECPICCEEEKLYELYCGHVLCKNCLKKDIMEQVCSNRPPRCRDRMPDNSLCNAEIMAHDVKELLDDDYSYKRYCKVILNNNISRNHDIKCCPNPFCDWIITPANRLPCHVGRCYRCNFVTCLKGDHDSHAPLINCEHIENFTVEVREEMEQLEQDQKSWFAREERLKDYRRNHISEVKSVLDKTIQQLREKQYLESKQEQKRIDDIGKELNDIQDQISALRRKLNEYLDKCMPKDEVNRLMSQIQDLSSVYNQKSDLQGLFVKDKKLKDQERSKYLKTAEQENGFFISALSGGQYQFFMTKFKESQEFRAYQNISITSNDDDLIKRLTKKCPKCHSPIQRDEGCNYMQCNICNFEFCWACEHPWHPTHGDHFKCPNIKTTAGTKKSGCGINFNDLNDHKFYPQPMSIDRRAEFIRYNNLYNKFREEKEKYQKLYEEFMNTENKEDISKGLDQVPDFKLCTRKRLEKVLKGCYNESDSEINAMRIMNTVLFAQSVIMWSYPSLYYMVRDPQKAQVFEFKVSSLENRKDNMLRYISQASSFTGIDLMNMKETLSKEIEHVIDDADIF